MCELLHSFVLSSISCKVEVSSIVLGTVYSFSFAIFLIVLLKILPLLVFGNLSVKITPCRRQKAPTFYLTLRIIYFSIFAISDLSKCSSVDLPFSTTNANGHSPFIGSSKPITALSTTISCSFTTSSRRPVLIL